MNQAYEDIKSRIKDPILWYDSNGVPRYDKHHPGLCPNIYADQVILLEIACQDCYRKFLVEMHWNKYMAFLDKPIPSLKDRIDEWLRINRTGSPVHYGDPPIHHCVGDTENCDDLQIVEFWEKVDFEWVRLPEYEIELEKMGG